MPTPQEARWYGLFLLEDIEGNLLRQIDDQHVTYGYNVTVPEDIPWGETYDIKVVGYAIDDNNEGYLVEVPEGTERWYKGAEYPHITLSVGFDGKPVDTWELPFEELDESFYLPAQFGYVVGNQVYF